MSPPALSLFASTLVALGVIRLGAAWPLKVLDFSDEGDLCGNNNNVVEVKPHPAAVPPVRHRPSATAAVFRVTITGDTTVEQYMQVETYDFHDNPKFTMTWRGTPSYALPMWDTILSYAGSGNDRPNDTHHKRGHPSIAYATDRNRQLTGACGADEPNPVEWTGSYDSAAGDEPPDDEGRVQLALYVCAPFGEYELELVVESTSEAGSTLEQRTAWQVEYGVNEFHIWDTVNGPLFDDEAYTPTVPGTYVWPLSGSTGYYSTLYAGPLPPIQCPDSIPAGAVYQGCFEDSPSDRTLGQDQLDLPGRENPTGMTLQVCADFCAEYQYFGVQYAYECFCGTASEFDSATASDGCGSTYQYLCTGDSTVTCGGVDAISIYEQTSATPAPAVVSTTGPHFPTPAPSAVSTTDPTFPTPVPAAVSTTDPTFPTPVPSAVSTTDPTFPTPVPAAVSTTDPNFPTPAPTSSTPSSSSYTYEGCFVDSSSSRIMSSKTTLSTLSAEICFGICDDGVNNYFGTQFSQECWCGVDSDLTANGEEAIESECDMDCAGTTTGEKCGGYYRISTYAISTTSTPTYVGCYGDAKSPRAMPGASKYSLADMTNELCWDRCSGLGYAYAGTQYGVECWCDDTFDTYGEVDACDYDCGGDASQTCGGFDALSVYEL